MLPKISGDLPLSADDYLNGLKMYRFDNYGRGHCIILSVLDCLKSVPTLQHLTFSQLVRIVLKHVLDNKEHYQQYCFDTANICAGIKDYFITRRSTTEICDMMPNILANALNVVINILSPTSNCGSNLIKVLPDTMSSPKIEAAVPEILLVRSDTRADERTHYMAALPIASFLPALSHERLQQLELEHIAAVENILTAATAPQFAGDSPPQVKKRTRIARSKEIHFLCKHNLITDYTLIIFFVFCAKSLTPPKTYLHHTHTHTHSTKIFFLL